MNERVSPVDGAQAGGVVRLHPADNVLVATKPIAAGVEVEPGVRTSTEVPAGHKIATRRIPEGSPVVKYGQVIATTKQVVEPGEHVHVHNAAMVEFHREHPVGTNVQHPKPADRPRTFSGFVRSDGSVGTRNYVGIVTTVNCSASVARMVAARFDASRLSAFPNVDGVVAITHGTGCGTVSQGEAFEILQRTLAGYVRHPNFAKVVVLGLGCEVNQAERLVGDFDVGAERLTRRGNHEPRVTYANIQDEGGTRATVEALTRQVEAVLPEANQVVRTEVSLEHLVVGLQCGGSDGFSGITANPALGYAADLVVAHGGSVILAETPEVYGAEHLLTARAVEEATAQKLLERIAWWKDYTRARGAEMDTNPSVGNKAGGLTTILEKSLGAVAKSGSSPLRDVLQYGEPLRTRGFNFMDSPGYDPCSVTGEVASGANVVCFTTGRGSVFGFKPVPSIKLATNSDVYRRMRDDMDINCGAIAQGEATIEDVGRHVFEYVIRVASGFRSRSEELGMGDSEFVPWSIGAVM